MFIIGIDPHKASHTATVIDGDETVIGELRIAASRSQRQIARRVGDTVRAAVVGGRGWTGAVALPRSSSSLRARSCSTCLRRCRRGHGCWTRAARTRPTRTMLAPRRSSRYGIRTCGASCWRITRRSCGCWHVVTISCPGTDPVGVSLARRAELVVEGGQGRKLSAKQATIVLDNLDITTCVEQERTRVAGELLDEVRHHDQLRRDLRGRIAEAVIASGTTSPTSMVSARSSPVT